jgi:hypothetical protein
MWAVLIGFTGERRRCTIEQSGRNRRLHFSAGEVTTRVHDLVPDMS